MRQKSQGLSMIEVMITCVLVGISVLLAGPSFTTYINTQRTLSAMNTMYADLRLAQSEAIKRQITVYFSLNTSGNTWCYGLNDNSTCNCTQANNCQLNGVNKVVDNTSFPNASVDTTLSGSRVSFEGVDGTASTTGTITITSGSQSNTITINDEGTLLIQ